MREAAKWNNHSNSESCFKEIYDLLKTSWNPSTEISTNVGRLGPRFDFLTFLEGDAMVDWMILVILVTFYLDAFLYLLVRLINN